MRVNLVDGPVGKLHPFAVGVRHKGTHCIPVGFGKTMAQPLLSHRFPEADWDAVRAFVSDPDGKLMQVAYRAINESDPHNLKINALNMAYEGIVTG